MKNENLAWTTKDGDTILIKDMDDRHLNNTLKFIERTIVENPLLSSKRKFKIFRDAMNEEIKKRFYDNLLKEKL